MTGSQRMLAIVIAAAMLISGFAFGRMAETPKTVAEEGKSALATAPAPSSSPTSEASPATSTETTGAASESQAFYLSDFKTGYTDGYNAGTSGQSSSVNNTTRAGYNDGFKNGYADGFQARAKQGVSRPVSRAARQEVVYRSSRGTVRRRGDSKLRTVLTIAAPAAIGAGIGAAAGGGKGAAAGALIGGGGGALYELLKNRNRN
ncbi:MAG TPA: hypothetical protein VKG02_08045 [Blastocatellia bacterium]|nr:hypothetical protein [Blastocatellia bacterium]